MLLNRFTVRLPGSSSFTSSPEEAYCASSTVFPMKFTVPSAAFPSMSMPAAPPQLQPATP